MDKKAIDGCAIFFNTRKYKVDKRYHVDFNETAKQYLGTHFSQLAMRNNSNNNAFLYS